ncbi:dihydroxyacetone kinase [Actinorhabdospora filicis]|uniref:Dihydroxyacetone kinase n=1 Tax=Actinorhabdospora filicis TaxID=1785913 RepID=A0A9W6SQ28_9ACTN|nr:DAK2 domain-containing protein [Actinorhabdospora filicis]GLZ79920.1 dihydroxyacetone kinase [Actinorhabdospora filicis]
MRDVDETAATIDAAGFHRWCAASLDVLRRHRRDIDELNVFPVPDGDTGTNMVATVTAGVTALDGGEITELAEALRRFARGALLGARGNSGVILAQFFRGLADAWAHQSGEATEAGASSVVTGLRVAADACRAAVAQPAEGTMLTIADAAARAAADAPGADLARVVTVAAEAAAEAVARTPTQLPALARAGVVDSGGFGLALVLDALVGVVTGAPTGAPVAAADLGERPRGRTGSAERETGSEEFAYEVQYLLEAPPDEVERLRLRLTALGDSLVVVGTGLGDATPTWNVHVHVNDIGAAIEAGIEAGRPHRISVTRFVEQHATGVAPPAPPGGAPRAVVAVAGGSGLADLFAAEGAHPVVSSPPSAGELLDAVRATGATEVILLPNDGNSHSTAATAAGLARAEGFQVSVVPTRSPVQALAALAVRDPARRFDDDVIAMAEAAGACRHGAIAIAARESITTAGRCAPGDVLGLAEGDVVLIGRDLAGVACELLDRMCGAGGELVTLVTGAGLRAEDEVRITAHMASRWPLVDVTAYRGGQRHQPLIVGVE